jgi:D-lactate dehydrogenase (cytochrome)
VRHRITARAPRDADVPRIDGDPAVVSAFLDDAAHVPGGFAAGVAFPADADEVATLVRRSACVLPIGAQSSLTGGATPRGGVILSTRALTTIHPPSGGSVRAGAGVALAQLQRSLATAGLYYPPVPTFDGAFVGGTISTNAAGPATFKYGSTRPWVTAVTLALADGSLLDLERGQVIATPDGRFEIERPSGDTTSIAIPSYTMPAVAKLSAGYFARPEMDLIDLFIGSEGTLGVVVDATLRVIPLPRRCSVLVACADDAQAVVVTAALREQARAAWRGDGPLDISAIEYMDARSLVQVKDEAFARAGISRPATGVLLLIQIDVAGDGEAALSRLQEVLSHAGVDADPSVAGPDDIRGQQRLFELRESVPAGVNAVVAAAKQASHPDIEKTAGDMIVPFERLSESIAAYRAAFEERSVPYAIWGHVSDGNLHINVVPRTLDDVHRGRECILDVARRVIAMGGAPLAEHGVGRSALKQQQLRELYGEDGIEQMRCVKRALDPEWKLSPGVLFPVA